MLYTICFCKLVKLSAIVLWHIVCYELGRDSMFGKNAFHVICYGKGTGASWECPCNMMDIDLVRLIGCHAGLWGDPG